MSEELKNAGCSASDCSSCCENCGSDQKQIPNTISLTLDDNTEVECAILTIYPVADKEYIALLPLDENGQNQDGEVYLYVFSRTEQGDPMLANIESDEEYEKAAEAFNTILENARNAEAHGEYTEEKGESLE
nr:DUF1292 domain-containing protein [uncultured Blautia sp.]